MSDKKNEDDTCKSCSGKGRRNHGGYGDVEKTCSVCSGTGITKEFKMRNDLDPELQKHLENMRDNLTIVFVKRAGGEVRIPVDEVDAANDLLTMEVDTVKREFVLKTQARN